MTLYVLFMIGLAIIIINLNTELKKAKNKITLLETERLNTRRVMYENGLIPKKFVEELEEKE